MVGGMGLFEMPLMLLLLTGLYFIPCQNDQFCKYGAPEDSWFAIQQLIDNPAILGMQVAYMVVVGGYKALATYMTKFTSAT